MAQDLVIALASLGQAQGTPLAHAHPVAIAPANRQQRWERQLNLGLETPNFVLLRQQG